MTSSSLPDRAAEDGDDSVAAELLRTYTSKGLKTLCAGVDLMIHTGNLNARSPLGDARLDLEEIVPLMTHEQAQAHLVNAGYLR